MNQEEIKAEVRLYAIESLLAQVLAGLCKGTPDPVAYFRISKTQAVAGTRGKIFHGVDPTMSDHYSAELELAVARLWDLVGHNLGISG